LNHIADGSFVLVVAVKCVCAADVIVDKSIAVKIALKRCDVCAKGRLARGIKQPTGESGCTPSAAAAIGPGCTA
jgi:hypothetical protein